MDHGTQEKYSLWMNQLPKTKGKFEDLHVNQTIDKAEYNKFANITNKLANREFQCHKLWIFLFLG